MIDLSKYNIEISKTRGNPIDTDCTPEVAAYKILNQFTVTYPEQLFIKLSKDDNPKETLVLDLLKKIADKFDKIFVECHDYLPKACFQGFSLISADKKTVYVFVPQHNKNPLIIKGISSKVRSMTNSSGEAIDYKRNNAMHNSSGILWVDTNGKPVDTVYDYIKIDLQTPLKLYLGSGAPITQN